MARTTQLGLSIALLAAIAGAVEADEAPSNRNLAELQIRILQAAERPPEPAAAVQSAQRRLSASVRRLETFLTAGGGQTAQGWSEWLRLPAVKAVASSPHPDAALIAPLAGRFSQNQVGLELPQFIAVRKDLQSLLAAAEYARERAPAELFRAQMKELAGCVTRLADQPTAADAHRAGALVAWLEALSEQDAELVATVRSRFCGTNGMFQFSGRLANVLLERNVEESSVIAATVLGSYTWGVAFMRGDVSFGVIPSTESGKLEVRLRGRAVVPENVAERRRVTVYTSATTSIFANKQVSITDLGLQLSRASAYCSTTVALQEVAAGSRLVERLAWRRAGRMLPEAEMAASRRAESEASTKLDQQADSALGGMNEIFCNKIRAPLIRLDALPASLRFWTDASHLRLSLSQRNDSQLAPAGPPPRLSPGFDIAGGAHESLLNNLCEPMLGGQKIEDKVWHDMLQIMVGNPPRPLWVHDRAERWSVTLAEVRPVETKFDSDRLAFVLRLGRVTRGAQHVDQPVEIEGSYAPRITRDGPLLVRDGELAIRVASGLEDGQEERLRNFLAAKFNAIFPPELYFHGLAPPAGGTLGKLRRLALVEFKSDGGWLTVGYQLTQ